MLIQKQKIFRVLACVDLFGKSCPEIILKCSFNNDTLQSFLISLVLLKFIKQIIPSQTFLFIQVKIQNEKTQWKLYTLYYMRMRLPRLSSDITNIETVILHNNHHIDVIGKKNYTIDKKTRHAFFKQRHCWEFL